MSQLPAFFYAYCYDCDRVITKVDKSLEENQEEFQKHYGASHLVTQSDWDNAVRDGKREPKAWEVRENKFSQRKDLMKAKEPQNQVQFDQYNAEPVVLGPYTSYIWRNDPKHLAFLFSRYKFVSKMLDGKLDVLEIGCGDAMGTPIVAQTTKHLLHATDFEPLLIEDNKKRLKDHKNITFSLHDIVEKPFPSQFDAVFALDVIEHIPPEKEPAFFKNICESLYSNGVCIIGTPNVAAHEHASELSKHGHVNLKSHTQFKELIKKYFRNGFLFSMNDEVVHTGYYPMAQYLIMVGIEPRHEDQL